jgi:DnaD/phage-associated family protein
MTETKPTYSYSSDNARQSDAFVSRFTPCPDVLVDKYSHTTAMVWGKIWRYCQMSNGICNAAIQRLADELGLTPKTISSHIATLEDGGYIADKTPTLRNVPHTYTDTGKLVLKINVFMEETPENGREFLRSRYVKITDEESTTKGDSETRNIFRVYEENIGALTPIISDILANAEKDYGIVWVIDAITLAVKNKKRNWRYCETILARWREEGKDDGEGKPAPKEAKRPTVEFVDGVAVLK